MISNNYKYHKDNVMDIFRFYKEKSTGLCDGNDMAFLQSRVRSLESGKYTLAIAGEVKAGKSTFINALLGAEVLPADVLQATSAIIEIFKSERAFLKVKYACGRVEEVEDDSSALNSRAVEKLRKICCVEERYRDLPITLLQNYVVYQQENVEVTEALLEEWQEQTNIRLVVKKDLINQYLKEYTLEKIPLEIQFGYPLRWTFDELRIVDSPGVNAVGGIQDIAFRFFRDANAILFIHPIKPIESESFQKFVKQTITSRSKETLFLVLTHAGLYPESDVERLHQEAVRLYKDEIPEERILVVDSLLKLIYNDLISGKSIKQIKEASPQKKHILPNFRERAEDEGKELEEALLEYSGFDVVFNAIEKFSVDAPNLQLCEILDTIKNGYEDQMQQYDEKLQRLHTKKQNPQEFAEEIERIQRKLDEYKNLSGKTQEEMKSHNYTGIHAQWHQQVEELKKNFTMLIRESATKEDVRKNCAEAEDNVELIIETYTTSIISEFRQKLAKIGATFREEHHITVPRVDMEAIEYNAMQRAFHIENIYERRYAGKLLAPWTWFTWKDVKVGQRQLYNTKQDLDVRKNGALEELYSIVKDLPEKFTQFLDTYLAHFNQEVQKVIAERQKALEEEKNKKQQNDEIMANIKEICEKKNIIPPQLERINEITEDLR